MTRMPTAMSMTKVMTKISDSLLVSKEWEIPSTPLRNPDRPTNRPIRECQFHLLHHHMDPLRRLLVERLQIKILQDIQQLRDMHPTGTRRRHPDDIISTTAKSNRYFWNCRMAGKILHNQQSTLLLHPAANYPGHRASIKPLRSMLPNFLWQTPPLQSTPPGQRNS